MERIESSVFEAVGSQLGDGCSTRIDHDCIGVSGGTLLVSRDGNKITAYCFRCGCSGFIAKQEGLAERMARLRKEEGADRMAVQCPDPPQPAVHDLSEWPKEAKLWLYRAGFTPAMIADLGAYWAPGLGRVVLPVLGPDHAPIFWQARCPRNPPRNPKIISPKAPRNGVVGRYGTGTAVVLCEDTLSAYKVGQVTEAWSLMGTKLMPGPLAELVSTGRRVYVWLDGDRPGQTAASAILKRLRAYGLHATNIVTTRDPKYYNRAAIRRLLC